MGDVVGLPGVIAAMSDEAVAMVGRFQDFTAGLEQVEIETQHLFHAGMYARTITIPAGVVLTGALIKIPTTLIVSGDVLMLVDGVAQRLTGYHVFAASAHRKQIFRALADTTLTMIFPTEALTVGDAERQFTDEYALLFSHINPNCITVTGE